MAPARALASSAALIFEGAVGSILLAAGADAGAGAGDDADAGADADADADAGADADADADADAGADVGADVGADADAGDDAARCGICSGFKAVSGFNKFLCFTGSFC